MVIFLISIIFFIEIFIFLTISRKVEFYNPILFFLALPIFYANSLFLDYLFFGQNYIQIKVMSVQALYVSDSNYLIIVLLTFSYVIGLFFSFTKKSIGFDELTNRTQLHNLYYEKHNTYNPLKFFIIFICIAYLIVTSFSLIGLSREEVRALGRPIRVLMLMGSFTFLCFSLMYKWKFKLLNTVILLTLIFFSIVSFQRENIAFLAFALLLNAKPKKITFYHVFFIILTIIFLSYYKYLVFLFNLFATDVEIANIYFKPFRFANVDPITSTLMLSDFIDDRSVYITYYGSYIVNTLMQFVRMGVDVNWISISEFTQEYYTQGDMGTAFSMIMESILNFWYFGPFVVGYFITYLFYRTEKAAGIYYKLLYLIFFIFMLKFVRTELAVVLKLYIFPAVVAYLIFIWTSKIKSLKN
jgi:hypothetical protein